MVVGVAPISLRAGVILPNHCVKKRFMMLRSSFVIQSTGVLPRVSFHPVELSVVRSLRPVRVTVPTFSYFDGDIGGGCEDGTRDLVSIF